ncbi:MAG: hypothetical protein Q4F43_04635 [Eubacteriales bacterium]|nr:hypothetical protein [Eubacteriales bacterium]
MVQKAIGSREPFLIHIETHMNSNQEGLDQLLFLIGIIDRKTRQSNADIEVSGIVMPKLHLSYVRGSVLYSKEALARKGLKRMFRKRYSERNIRK